MIARGSTRLTVPVISSPSRLANWSKTWSPSTSRIRCRTICFAVWAPIRPKTSPSSCSVSTRSPRSASGWIARAWSTVISVNSSSISPTTRRARKTRILPVSASIRTWMSSAPSTRRYADWMPSSTAPISCSREICFSALSWRRAPTKSRLTMASVRCAGFFVAAQKETWGSPTSRSGRSVRSDYTPESLDGQGEALQPEAVQQSSGLLARAPAARICSAGRLHRMDVSTDDVVLFCVVAARVLVPLAIFRFPLPAMLAALVIDGLDQTIFQTFTNLDLNDYQSYDKALDVYYLSMAYLAMLRNWVSRDAFDIGRFLFYFRLVGTVIFEQTQIRALLLIFPNTFEYFFDTYEAIRTLWDPRRLARNLLLGIAAFIWIFIKLPQEWFIHVAQLDATDLIRQAPWIVVVAVVAAAIVAVIVWRLVVPRLDPADHPFTVDADKHQPMVAGEAIDRERRRIADQVIDLELVEKVTLIGLVSIIFSRMLPGADPAPVKVLVAVGVLVVVNTLISSVLVRIGDRPHGAIRTFIVFLVMNVALVLGAQFLLETLRGVRLEHALVYVVLLSLIVTAYDRYRPLYKARFANGPLPAPR